MLLNNKQQFSYFAAPRPGQSGLGWMWNRVAVDAPLSVVGATQAIRGKLDLQGLAKYRRAKLDALDFKQSPIPYSTPKPNLRKLSGPVGSPDRNLVQPKVTSRTFDDPIVESPNWQRDMDISRDYWSRNEHLPPRRGFGS